jgi:hypothetical protein
MFNKENKTMFNQPENEMQQPQNPEEVRQAHLAKPEARKQAVAESGDEQLLELSDQELEQIAGGILDPLIRQKDGSYKPLFPYDPRLSF